MTIQEALQNILQAVFGKDVRQSIHDGIDAINKESKADMEAKQTVIDEYTKRQNGVISDYTGKMDILNSKYEEQIKNMTLASPSDAEIVDARRAGIDKVYGTLKDRLDGIYDGKPYTIEDISLSGETSYNRGTTAFDLELTGEVEFLPATCVNVEGTVCGIDIEKFIDEGKASGRSPITYTQGAPNRIRVRISIDEETFPSANQINDVGPYNLIFHFSDNPFSDYTKASLSFLFQTQGSLSDLIIPDKTTIVSAINELMEKLISVKTDSDNKTEIITVSRNLNGNGQAQPTVNYTKNFENPVAFIDVSDVTGNGIGVASPSNIHANVMSINKTNKTISLNLYNTNTIDCSFKLNIFITNIG